MEHHKPPSKKRKDARLGIQRTIRSKYPKLTWRMTILVVLVLGSLYWAYHIGRQDKNKQKPPIPVLVSQIQKKDVPLYLETIGTVTPIDSIIVKTQINGHITDVLFQEGQLVQKGELLVQIDPRPYEASLEQAQGQLTRDEAQLKNARLDLRRYKQLYKEDSISQQTLDTQSALVKQLEGTVQSDQGIVNSAKVTLDYCKIISDITGVVGLRQVNPGNFVQTSDTTPITTVNTISPISVVFPIPEDDLVRVQQNYRKTILTVDAFDRKQENLLCSGELSAIDSQIDNTTGTIKLKAIFKNEHYTLYPNQFVNVRLKIDTFPDAFVVPTAAIQMGRQGPFIYILNEEHKTVSSKQVVLKTTLGEDSAFTGDVKEGQHVVIQGQDKLTEGTVVAPSSSTPSSGQAPQ